MRPLFFLPAALVFAATSASAQTVSRDPAPLAYLCTPDAQVIKVTDANTRSLLQFALPRNKTTAVVPLPSNVTSSSAGISECVLGPDGLLYAARGYSIVRFPVSDPAASDVKLVANLPTSVSATGLAFNLDTLYVSTSENKTRAIPLATGAVPITAPAEGFHEVGVGQGGVAFGVDGTLVVSSTGTPNGVVNNYAPPYGGFPVPFTVGAPKGVAVNTCGEVLVADKNSKSVKRASDGALRVQFPLSGADYPVHLEVESGNRVFIVTVQNDSGLNGKLWLANFDFGASNCGPLPQTQQHNQLFLLADLGVLSKGPTKLAGLASSLASGVAAGPSSVSITHSFSPGSDGSCMREFLFGYHRLDLSFAECGDLSGDLKITAVKSPYALVDFNSDIDPNNEMQGMRYSPMGGFVVQYLLQPIDDPNNLSDLFDLAAPLESLLPEFNIKYGFFTQESISEPGVARESSDQHKPETAYDDLVGAEFWNIGVLDPAAGERERDWSKRVVYNKTPTDARGCAFPEFLDQPLNHQNPLFNGPQNIKFAFTAIATEPGADCSNATVRLSIVRVEGASLNAACEVVAATAGATYTPQPVVQTNGQGGNLFTSVGMSYQLNLAASFLNTDGPPAQFVATLWGDLAAPKNVCFVIQKQ